MTNTHFSQIATFEDKNIAIFEQDYPVFIQHLTDAHDLLTNFPSYFEPKVSDDRLMIFFGFYQQIVTTWTCGLMSLVRLHEIPAMMSLRYAFEASCAAAYSIYLCYANPGKFDKNDLVNDVAKKFQVNIGDPGETIDRRDKHKKEKAIQEEAYKWIEQAYPDYSSILHSYKKNLHSFAHVSLDKSNVSFNVSEKTFVVMNHFDPYPNPQIETYLWLFGNVVIGFMYVFTDILSKEAKIQFNVELNDLFSKLISTNKELNAQI